MNQIVETPDLFLDRQDRVSFRDITNLMEFPFFSISKTKVMEKRIYDDGKVRFEVRPGPEGLATIWDKDLLIFVASHINRCMNEGVPVSQRVRFHAHDFFVSCGRSTGGRAYQDLEAALDRLQSTTIRTNIKTGASTNEKGFFSWIKSGKLTERELPNGRKVTGMVEVEMEDWLWRQIVEDRTILSIDAGYFKLTSGIARRVYELARKHCGTQPTWSINLLRLAEKIGYEDKNTRYFKQVVLDIVQANDLPEYQISLSLAGDKSDTALVDAKLVRGLKALKVVFHRRANASDRRVTRRTAQIASDTRVETAPNVSERRVEPRFAPEHIDDPVTAADFASFPDLVKSLVAKKGASEPQ